MRNMFVFYFLFFSICSYCQAGADAKLAKKFQDSVFEIRYPATWKINEEPAVHEIVLYPPSIGDDFDTSVNVFVMEGDVTNIQEYAQTSKELLSLRGSVSDIKILDSSNGKMLRIVYVHRFRGMQLSGVQYRYIKKGYVYSLSFIGEEKSEVYYREIAEEVMKSFRFKAL